MSLTDEHLIEIPGLLSRWVRLPNGVKCHYVTSGQSGPNVLLLHGGIVGSSGTAGWRFMAPFLGAHGFRVFCPDMPAFGLTEKYEDVYAPGDTGHLEFIHDFVTTLCLDKVHISGNSMGCINAVNYITAHPDHILSYALIAGAIGDIAPLREIMAADPRPADQRPNVQRFDGTPESMRAMMSAVILDPSRISDDLVAMRTYAANRTVDFHARHMAAVANGDLDPISASQLSTKGRFDRLPIPGIYMYGTEDVLVPHDISGYRQEDALPHVQFFYPEKTGHQGQTDQPDLFNTVFLEFFRDGQVSWETAQRAGISTRRPPNPALAAAAGQ